MALQLILGNSGSGKTEYIYRKIVGEARKNPLDNYLVIVPEQFTLQTQKMLVELSPNHAIMNIDVLSFKRLAYRIFDELGVSELTVLDEIGKNLVLRKVAEDKKNHLSVLKSNMNRIGYINEVKSLLSEFVQYNITVEDLHGYIEGGRLSPALASKLQDVEVLYEGYQEFMQNRFTTTEELLNVLRMHVKESSILKGSTLIFDEFTGFTPIQNQLLMELFGVVKDVYLTLTIDGKEDMFHSRGMQDLFDMPKKTIASIHRIASQSGMEIRQPVILMDSENKRFKNSKDLAILEKNLFRKTYSRKLEAPQNISITNLNNPREELEYVARKIRQLVQKEGYRYQDIAVVSGDTETYGNYAENIFSRYDIPVFIDETKPVVFHPFIEFVKAGLEVMEKDFSYESVFRFLRTGFLNISEDDVDILENYILATGIGRRKGWSRRFVRIPRNLEVDLAKMEELRSEIYGVFEPVLEVFGQERVTVRERLIALYNMMYSLQVEQKLKKRAKEYLELGDEVHYKEYDQIFELIMHIFEKYVDLLGDDILTLKEFNEILSAGLDAAKTAIIPPGKDCVILGDIERTRLDKVRVLFLIGANDGIIPKANDRGGIISAYEREALKELDIELAPGAREQSFIQRYYLYLNLTKPSESIFITYSRGGMDGKLRRPSYLIGVLKRIYPKLEEQFIENLEENLDISTEKAALEYLVHGNRTQEWYELANYFLKQDSEKNRVMELLKAGYSHYKDEPISAVVARAIYGNEIHGSVTRLERFAQCAYLHFLQYGVRLKERDENAFSDMDMGNLYHDAIYLYSTKLEKDDVDWFGITDEHRKKLAKEAFDEACLNYAYINEDTKNTQLNQIHQMEAIFQRTIWALTRQVRAGRFVPEQFEIQFSKVDDMEALNYDLQDGCRMSLKGRIDRMDTCKNGEKLYIKIVDYKSGSTSYDLLKIYQGTQLQLLVYMNAALESQKKKNPDLIVEPGAVFYYHIDNPQVDWKEELTQQEVEEALLKKLMPDGPVNSSEEVYHLLDEDMEKESNVIPVSIKKDGEFAKNAKVLSAEEFETVSDFVTMKVKQMGEDIYHGVVSVNPKAKKAGSYESDACSYCPYKSVCKINSKIPGYEVQAGEDMNGAAVLDRMNTELALQNKR